MVATGVVMVSMMDGGWMVMQLSTESRLLCSQVEPHHSGVSGEGGGDEGEGRREGGEQREGKGGGGGKKGGVRERGGDRGGYGVRRDACEVTVARAQCRGGAGLVRRRVAAGAHVVRKGCSLCVRRRGHRGGWLVLLAVGGRGAAEASGQGVQPAVSSAILLRRRLCRFPLRFQISRRLNRLFPLSGNLSFWFAGWCGEHSRVRAVGTRKVLARGRGDAGMEEGGVRVGRESMLGGSFRTHCHLRGLLLSGAVVSHFVDLGVRFLSKCLASLCVPNSHFLRNLALLRGTVSFGVFLASSMVAGDLWRGGRLSARLASLWVLRAPCAAYAFLR
ncbi:hypothetical protein Tco_1533108 [Tanacetum coccineum]